MGSGDLRGLLMSEIFIAVHVSFNCKVSHLFFHCSFSLFNIFSPLGITNWLLELILRWMVISSCGLDAGKATLWLESCVSEPWALKHNPEPQGHVGGKTESGALPFFPCYHHRDEFEQVLERQRRLWLEIKGKKLICCLVFNVVWLPSKSFPFICGWEPKTPIVTFVL